MFGFAAAGNAGKALSKGVEEDNVVDETPGDRELGRDAGREEDEGADGASQAAVVARPAAPARADDPAGIGGNGFAEAALPQLPCLLTAEREDCAVEFLSLRIRRPPLPAAAADEPGSSPLGPGRDG